jgi:hypothetical protein
VALKAGWLTVDTHEPAKLAEFWRQALDMKVLFDEEGEVAITGPGWAGTQWGILFYKVDDEKTVKNRLHLDLIPDDQAAEVERLKGLGATEADIGQKDVTWVVMADPEGNEFCILSPRPDPTEKSG